jgi:hypothetical protein
VWLKKLHKSPEELVPHPKYLNKKNVIIIEKDKRTNCKNKD